MNSAEKQAVLHCLKSMIDEEVCEECPLYGTTGTDHCEKDCVRMAINALSSSGNTPKQSFEDMTNGEVIRTVFSDKDYLIIADRLQHTKWWDASYNGGEQNEADN